MRTSQYGAPSTSTASNSELYTNIITLRILALPCTPAKIIINLAMKSHPFPDIPLFLVTTACLLAAPSFAADKKAPPAKPANQYAAFDTHAKEQLTIAADPCDDPKDCDFFRLPYV